MDEACRACIEDLGRYANLHPKEGEVARSIATLVREHSNPFSRTCVVGHVTGSAFITDTTMGRILLVHHAKLHKWLQPGGHCEAGEGALDASRREAFEETGIAVGPPHSLLPFDIDIHAIPARAAELEHLHLDIRYLFVVEESAPRLSEESTELAWLDLDEALRRNPEPSILRAVDKLRSLQRRRGHA
ncbi:MAG: NUDIX hydrolase [Spirochaetota bacterium]